MSDDRVANRPQQRPATRVVRAGVGRGQRIRAVYRLLLGVGLGWVAGLTPIHATRGASGDLAPFRLGFSSSTFGEVNENDAVAAVKMWSKVLAEDQALAVDPQPRVFRSLVEIRAALQQQSLDAINLTTDEFRRLRELLAVDRCILGVQNDSFRDEYVVLVRGDRGFAGLDDLRGRSLTVHESPRTRVAPIWLESLLLAQQKGRLTNHFGRIDGFNKLTRAVLPVFFRQTDACLVTRRGFAVMVELNPQVGRELKPLLVSPPFVPFLFAFRGDYTSPVRERVLVQLKGWHTTAAGRQILTLFQCDRVEVHPVSLLVETLNLLDTHAAYGTAP